MGKIFLMRKTKQKHKHQDIHTSILKKLKITFSSYGSIKNFFTKDPNCYMILLFYFIVCGILCFLIYPLWAEVTFLTIKHVFNQDMYLISFTVRPYTYFYRKSKISCFSFPKRAIHRKDACCLKTYKQKQTQQVILIHIYTYIYIHVFVCVCV